MLPIAVEILYFLLTIPYLVQEFSAISRSTKTHDGIKYRNCEIDFRFGTHTKRDFVHHLSSKQISEPYASQ